MLDLQYSTRNIKVPFASAKTDFKIEAGGDFLLYDEGVQPITIKLDNNKAHSIQMRPKDVIHARFAKFYVSGNAGHDVYLKLIGSPNNTVNVDSAGRVVEQVLIDQTPDYETIKYRNLFAATIDKAAIVGQYAHFQLWNPADSGKTLTLLSMTGSIVPTTSGLVLAWYNTKLTTGVTGYNAYGGGASPSGGVYCDGSASLLTDGDLSVTCALANVRLDMVKGPGYVIPPGKGVLVANKTQNQQARFSCVWREKYV